jgi:hypothetical protein
MTLDPKQVAVLVREMVTKHGHMAPQAAAEHGCQWAMAGEEETALLWFAVTEVVATIMASSNHGLERIQ